MKKNRIILLILALILLVGIIMVCVKGFQVSLNLRAHDTLKFVFDQKFQMNDITKICDEVLKDKEYEIRTVEVFSDAIYIISPTITEKEEKALLEKLDALYRVEETKNEDQTSEEVSEEPLETIETEEGSTEMVEKPAEETIFDKLEKGKKYELYHDSKVRLRDIVKPYIAPSIISATIIIVYMCIRYRKLNQGKVVLTVGKTLLEMLVILLEIMAVIAILRIPFTRTLIPILMFMIVICLCIRFASFEKQMEE